MKSKLLTQLLIICFYSTITYSQEFEWLTKCGSASNESAYDIRHDHDQNVYVVGNFSPGCANPVFDTIDPFNVPTSGGGFIAKYTEGGQLLWYKIIKGWVYLRSLDIQESQLYIAGDFGNYFVIDGDTTYSEISTSVLNSPLVLKMDTTGVVAWSKTWYAPSHATVVDIRSNETDGSVYVSGDFGGGQMIIDNINIDATGFNNQSYLLKLTSDGVADWANQFGTTGYDYNYAMDIDLLGNAYLTGKFSGSLIAGNNTLVSVGSSDVYVLKCGFDGNWVWAQKGGANGSDKGTDVYFNQANNKVYLSTTVGNNNGVFGNLTTNGLTGTGSEAIVLLTINPESGDFETMYHPSYCTGGAEIAELDADLNGNIYLFGRLGLTNHRIAFGTDTLTSNSVRSGFVVSFDKDFNHRWTKQINTSFFVTPSGLDVAPYSGQIYFSGNFEGNSLSAGANSVLNSWPSTEDGFWGKITTEEIIVDPISGINEIENNTMAYPNPVSNELTIKSNDAIELIEIYSITGQKINSEFQQLSSNTLSIDCSNIPDGVYLLKLNSKSTYFYQKVIVKH